MQTATSEQNEEKMRQKIYQWKAGLADLGRRNSLVKFRTDKEPTIELLPSPPFDAECGLFILRSKIASALSILGSMVVVHLTRIKQPSQLLTSRALLNQGEVPICTLNVKQNGAELTKSLKKLRAKARESLEQRGVNSLFLAYGTLKWYDTSSDKPDEALISPLILIPVELYKERAAELYSLGNFGDDICINPTLAQKLKQTFGINFPDDELIQTLSYQDIFKHIRAILLHEPKWEINEQACYLSLFSYAKAAMIQDIINNEALIFKHPILQALWGDLTAYQANIPEIIDATKIDSHIQPERVYQVLDADSSQQVVIEAAKAGLNFVVQGPPGTGKSQTIVNMVAELIGMGKSVLLVAEKETALNVVYERLASCGLEDACLNLHHSSTKDKKALTSNLKKTTERLEKSIAEDDYRQFFQRLKECRHKLNSYPASLHAKDSFLQKSAFELFGELIQYERRQIPSIDVSFSNFNQWSDSSLHRAKDLLTSLAQFIPFFKSEKSIIWAKSNLTSYSVQLKLELTEKIEDFRRALSSVQKVGEQINTLIGLDIPKTANSLEEIYQALSHLATIPTFPSGWLEQINNVKAAKKTLNQLKADIQSLQDSERALSNKYSPELFSSDLKQLASRYQNYGGLQVFLWFNADYNRDRKRLIELRKINSEVSDDELKRDLAQAVKVQDLRRKLNDSSHPARQLFGSLLNSQTLTTSELQPIEQALNWLSDLRQKTLPINIVQKVIGSNPLKQQVSVLAREVQTLKEEIEKGIIFLCSHFSANEIYSSGLHITQAPLNELENLLDTLQLDLESLQGWLEYREIITQLESLGASRFMTYLKESNLTPDLWYTVLEKRLYEIHLESIISQKPELRNLMTEAHQQIIQEFAKLDSQQFSIASKRLHEAHASRWHNFKAESDSHKQIQVLNKEVNKKRSHFPIRKLLSKLPGLVKALKPCWMMSPLSVSQYVDANIFNFDVLIFDEASQIRTEDVVPSILRSKQVVVIGDNKQLPPTSFFVSGTTYDDELDEEDATYESVLDECSVFLTNRTLKWHYRSLDERLIAFSNRHFYHSQLITFPNPVKDSSLGINFHHVSNGIYDRGGRKDNQREAETTAQLALEHFNYSRNLSLGIITFSEAQADAIQEQLEILGKNNLEFQAFCEDNSPQFFLKALENVQGDERDAIILSVGYARDKDGKLYYNFGPLNRQGGERRLNVAITRAKRKITVVSSIQASDIDLARTNSKGLHLLRDYLAYAASGGEIIEGNNYSDIHKFDSPFEEDVYLALTENGYTVRTQIGYSGYRIDLGVVNKQRPGEFILGIECDGASYHSSPTARDRDRLRQSVLEKLGWEIHRIWSTEWFRDKPGQLNILLQKLENLSTE